MTEQTDDLQLSAQEMVEMARVDPDKHVRAAIDMFPSRFGLRAYPDGIFQIAPPPTSYFDPSSGIHLVVQRLTSASEAARFGLREGFNDFSRCTVHELRRELTTVPGL